MHDHRQENQRRRDNECAVELLRMKCDICPDDDGKGIHYHAFIDGKHHWVCESCKKKLKIEAEHMDD